MIGTNDALAPFVPSAEAPFDDRRAAHLLRRAGFGVPAASLTRALDEGLEATVARLVRRRDDPAVTELDAVVRPLASGEDVLGLAAWWITRMLRTDDPLREKVALFWHGHFATSNDKVKDASQMLGQLRLFLDLGSGPFAPLLTQVAEDPAMLSWLDGERNRKGHPNENFARELFELFTLGIGHYTERDIQEAARALTGWRRAGGSYRYVEGRHDDGEKEVLGRRGPLDQADVLALCVAHDATARRLARGLLRFFAHPSPPDRVVDEAARRLASDELHVGRWLATLFRSRWFHSDDVIEARILSPIEFVVGHLRTLGARANAKRVEEEVARLGQALFRPPSVKGWDGEDAWIHSASMIARIDCAARLASGSDEGVALQLDRTLLDGGDGGEDLTAEELADRAVGRILNRRIDPPVRHAVARHVAEASPAKRGAAAVAAVLSLPDASIG